MHIELIVEEESAEAALHNLLPKILNEQATFRILVHQGKLDLLKKLPGRLAGYASWLPADWLIVVLIDEDREDCMQLKQRLERMAFEAGLLTASNAQVSRRAQVINRIAIEELEAWFFGDVQALTTAFPRVSRSLDRKARFRDPDRIQGGTWETLERILQRAGYYHSGLAKIDVARRISAHMEPDRNRSRSFQSFCQALG